MNGTLDKLLLLLLSLLGYLKGFHGSDYTGELRDIFVCTIRIKVSLSDVDYLLDETQLDTNATDISYGYILYSDINEITNNSNNNESKSNSNNPSLDPFIGITEVNYSLNETLAPQQEENTTETLYGHILTSGIQENNNSTSNTSHILNKNSNFDDSSRLDPLIKIALIALMLHILIIGGGKQFSIYTTILYYEHYKLL